MNLKTKQLLLFIAMSTLLYDSAAWAFTPTVDAGTTVNDETVDGIQYVYGTTINNTVNTGYQNIKSGGTATGTTVKSGAQQQITNGSTGVANGTVVEYGGNIVTYSETGQVQDATIYGKLSNGRSTDINSVIKTGGEYSATGSPDSVARSYNANFEYNSEGTLNGLVETFDWTVSGLIFASKAYGEDYAPIMTRTTLKTNGGVILSNGVTMLDSIVDGGTISTSASSGELFNTINNTVMNSGFISLRANGKANNTTVNGGRFAVYVGATSDNLNMFDGITFVDGEISNSAIWGGELTINTGISNDTVLNGGTVINIGGSDINTIVNSGGFYTLNSTGAATSSNLTVNTGAIANINAGSVTGATINGDMFIGYDTAAADISTLTGNVAVNDGGNLTIAAGANTALANIDVASSGAVYLVNNPTFEQYDFSMGELAMNGGKVVFAAQDVNSSLTLASLSGAGSFYLNTNISETQANILNVTGEANGNFGIYVADSGLSPTSMASTQIVKTGGGSASFLLSNSGGLVDVGTYQYYLLSDGAGEWLLAPQLKKTELLISPSTAAILSMATVDPLIFQNIVSAVRSRLDEVRSFSHDTNAWVRVLTNRSNVDDLVGAGYNMRMNGVSVGIDKSRASEQGITTQGIFAAYTHTDVNFERKGSGNVEAYSVGLYSSYLHNSGFYIDGIIKASQFGNDVNALMTGGERADGYYNTRGVGFNIQGGKYFNLDNSYINPYLALAGITTNASEYQLSSGMSANIGPQRSVTSDIGVNIGHNLTMRNIQIQPYVRLSATTEFINDNNVNVNSDSFTTDLSGTRGVYQVGINAKLTEQLTVHADAGYTNGPRIESPITANLGVSLSF